MLLPCLQRLPWQLICLLFASVAAATISPSNTTTARPGFINGTSDMDHAANDGGKIADLIPLTKQAASAVRLTLSYSYKRKGTDKITRLRATSSTPISTTLATSPPAKSHTSAATRTTTRAGLAQMTSSGGRMSKRTSRALYYTARQRTTVTSPRTIQ
jgi:hypothetical protein